MTSKGALNHEPTINIDLIVPLRRLKEGLPPAEIAVKINAWPGVILKVQLSKESQVDNLLSFSLAATLGNNIVKMVKIVIVC